MLSLKSRLGTLVLLLLAGAGLAETDLNPPELESIVRVGLQAAYEQRYEDALATFDELQARYPDNPAGDFFLGALWQLYMWDYSNDSIEPRFLHHMAQAERKAKEILECEENARAHLYIGAARAYRAIFNGLRGKYWATFKEGIRAPGELKQALSLDSTLADAYLGLGVSEYFHYAAGRYLTGLSLFGSKEKAIRLLDRAIDGSGYFDVTASFALVWVLTQERRFSRTRRVLGELLTRYPENRVFRRHLRDVYFAEKNYVMSIAIGEEIGRALATCQPDNISGRAENDLRLAKCYFLSGDMERTRQCCDAILAHEAEQDRVMWLPNYVREAKALKKKLTS